MLNKERFMCAELLFKPQNDGLNFEGIEKVIFNSIMKCKPEIQKELFFNIVLSGGTSKLRGLKERIQKEIVNLQDNGDANVITNPYTNFFAWKGASKFASLSTSTQKYIFHDEYNDSGSNIVNIKCTW